VEAVRRALRYVVHLLSGRSRAFERAMLAVLLGLYVVSFQSIDRGRRDALVAVCSTQVGVSTAGRETLTGDILPPELRPKYTPAERKLRKLAADRYEARVAEVAQRVARQQGVDLDIGDRLLSCADLLRLANVSTTP
jgi:hypothetical protein